MLLPARLRVLRVIIVCARHYCGPTNLCTAHLQLTFPLRLRCNPCMCSPLVPARFIHFHRFATYIHMLRISVRMASRTITLILMPTICHHWLCPPYAYKSGKMTSKRQVNITSRRFCSTHRLVACRWPHLLMRVRPGYIGVDPSRYPLHTLCRMCNRWTCIVKFALSLPSIFFWPICVFFIQHSKLPCIPISLDCTCMFHNLPHITHLLCVTVCCVGQFHSHQFWTHNAIHI